MDVFGADVQRLVAEPDEVAGREVGLDVGVENIHQRGDVLDVADLQQLLGDRLEEGLLGADAADVLRAVAGAVVVVAEADDLHRLLPVEMARAFGEVNVQVLIGVVIIHVDGNVKIHAVDLIDQRDEALEIDRDIEINRYAEQVFDLLHQQLRAALGVGEVELVVAVFIVQQRIARETHKVDALVRHVEADEDVRVAAAVVVVKPGDENVVAVFAACTAQSVGLVRAGPVDVRACRAIRRYNGLVRVKLGRAKDIFDRRKHGGR